MTQTASLWISIALLVILCVPVLIWLLHWLRNSGQIWRQGRSPASLKCQSCSHRGACPSVSTIMAKLQPEPPKPSPPSQESVNSQGQEQAHSETFSKQDFRKS